MKRLKAILVLIAMSLTSFSAIASDTALDGIYYDFDSENKTARVTYRGNNYYSYSDEYTGDVVIPAKVTYEGVEYAVTAIGEWAFEGCSGLTSITIPEGVTAIGEGAFSDCSGLTSITIPEGVTAIGDATFCDCSGLTSITIPEGVTEIGNSAFGSCSGLTSITIPEGVTAIENYAFDGCSGLTSITIPEGVTAIGESAFSDCDGLTSIIVDENNTTYDSRNNCNAIIETASNTLIVGCKLTVIPEGVTAIGDYAFYDCDGLTSITIPESVTAIGKGAFYWCSGLTSITIPEGVTAIGDYAFFDCDGLTSITISESVTAIGKGAFYWCSGLTSITIPEGVTAIVEGAFSECDGLTSIIVDENNTTYDSRNNCNAIIETASNTLIVGCKSTVIPEGVTAIGESAFDGCDGLTSITIPEGVTAIGYYAFEDCSGLTSIISLNTTPPSCDGSSVFDYVDKSIPLYVPKESVDSYKSAQCWSEFTNIIGNMLRLTINDAVNGMVTGAGVYPVDSTATVTATPNAGYAFVKWSDGNTDNPRKIVMTEDVTLEAIFEVDSSPISNVTAEEITVRVVNGTLVVTGASDYLVYDFAGKCMGKPERLERGIYIVVADGNSYKMIVK